MVSVVRKVINVACIGSTTSENKFSNSSSENEIISPPSKSFISGIMSSSVWVCAYAIPTLDKEKPRRSK